MHECFFFPFIACFYIGEFFTRASNNQERSSIRIYFPSPNPIIDTKIIITLVTMHITLHIFTRHAYQLTLYNRKIWIHSNNGTFIWYVVKSFLFSFAWCSFFYYPCMPLIMTSILSIKSCKNDRAHYHITLAQFRVKMQYNGNSMLEVNRINFCTI